jgi:hypothetical protein
VSAHIKGIEGILHRCNLDHIVFTLTIPTSLHSVFISIYDSTNSTNKKSRRNSHSILAIMTGLTGMFSERYTFDDIPDQTGKVALVTGGRCVVGFGCLRLYFLLAY